MARIRFDTFNPNALHKLDVQMRKVYDDVYEVIETFYTIQEFTDRIDKHEAMYITYAKNIIKAINGIMRGAKELKKVDLDPDVGEKQYRSFGKHVHSFLDNYLNFYDAISSKKVSYDIIEADNRLFMKGMVGESELAKGYWMMQNKIIKQHPVFMNFMDEFVLGLDKVLSGIDRPAPPLDSNRSRRR